MSDRLRFEPIVSTERFDELRASRGAVYGDPKENHSLIAGQWAAILQPWGAHIAAGKPLPPHVVALCMVGLKLNRMRLAYHRDNYEDLGVYASMAMKWQQEWDEAQSQEADRQFAAQNDAPEKCPTPAEWELKQKFQVAPPSIHQDSKAWETIFPEPIKPHSGKAHIPWASIRDEVLRPEVEKELEGWLSRIRPDVYAPSGMVLGIVKNAFDKLKVPSLEDYNEEPEEENPSPSVYNWHRYAAQRGMTE